MSTDAKPEPVTHDFIAAYASPQKRQLPAVSGWQSFYPMILFVVGIAFGLVVLGWWVWPVKWVNAGFQHLRTTEQAQVVELAADLLSYDLKDERITEMFEHWPDAWRTACSLAGQEPDRDKQIRLVTLAYILNKDGCNG